MAGSGPARRNTVSNSVVSTPEANGNHHCLLYRDGGPYTRQAAQTRRQLPALLASCPGRSGLAGDSLARPLLIWGDPISAAVIPKGNGFLGALPSSPRGPGFRFPE